MYKENGRLTPMDKKEKSKLKGKKFKCIQCGCSHTLPSTQFGEVDVCSECGGTMLECVDYFD